MISRQSLLCDPRCCALHRCQVAGFESRSESACLSGSTCVIHSMAREVCAKCALFMDFKPLASILHVTVTKLLKVHYQQILGFGVGKLMI